MSARQRAKRGNFARLGEAYGFGRLGTQPVQPNEAPDGFTQLTHDFTQMDRLPSQISFSRTGPAWDYQLREYADGAPRLVPPSRGQSVGEGWLIEEGRTNKVTEWNEDARPLSGTAFNGFTYEVVPIGALPAPVRDGLFKTFPGYSGSAIYRGNSAVADSGFNFAGPSGNTNAHSLQIAVYPITGGTSWQVFYEQNETGTPTLNAGNGQWSFAKNENVVPNFTTSRMRLRDVDSSNANECYFFLMGMEEGAFVTSPIVTSGTAQTRNAEAASESLTTTNDFSVLVTAETPPLPVPSGNFPVLWAYGTNTNNTVRQYISGSSQVHATTMRVAATEEALISFSAAVANERFSTFVSVTRSSNTLSGSFNNGTTQSSSGSATPSTTTINFGSRIGGGSEWNSFIRTFALWDRLLSELPSGFDSGFDGGFGS